MNQTKIEKDLRLLKIYAVSMTLVCVVLFGSLFKVIKNVKFEEINVERINVVEKDGKLRMVISNQSRQHPGTLDGVTFDERNGSRPPGIIFFGEKGDEIGGLVFDGGTGKGQGGSLTFDKFRGDQTIQFIHEEDKDENYFAGLKMNDQYAPLRDKGAPMTERLKIGRDFDKSSVIKLKDAKGKVRIELKVEADGNSKLNFLDEKGKVTYSLPDDAKLTGRHFSR